MTRIKKKPPQSSLSRSTSPPIRKRTGGELKEYKHYSQANRRGTFKNTNIIRKRTGGSLKKSLFELVNRGLGFPGF